MPDTQKKHVEIPLTGKLMTADPATIGTNFQTLTNMRYTDGHIQSVAGNAKCNSTALTTYLKTRNAYHFKKYQPAETHLLTQTYDTGLAASQILQNTGAVPIATGAEVDFSATALWTDTSGGGLGRFCPAPDGKVVYCNGVDSLIWGGVESKIGAFITSTAAVDVDGITTGAIDSSEKIQNTLTDAENRATISSCGAVFLVGSPVKLHGIKVYVYTANTVSSTLTGSVWHNTAWDALTITDATDTGASLAQTGWITFGNHDASPRYIDGYYLYWYQFTLSAGIAETSYVTVDAAFQSIVDLWDGVYRDISAFYYIQKSGDRVDLSANVYRDDYDKDITETYANINSLHTSGSLEFGFTEKMTGLQFRIPPDYTNSAAGTTCTVEYWNGSAYATVGTISDGTAEGGISFAKSGVITWNNASLTSETKNNILQSAVIGETTNTSVPLYFYRLTFDVEFDETVRVNYVGGISAPKTMKYYKFPVFAQGRTLLCADMAGDKNKATVSGKYMPNVYNGADSVDIYFGDDGELTCGLEIFSQYGSNLYSMILMFKDNQTWIVSGQDITVWENNTFMLSNSIGCPAPLTLKLINLTTEAGQGINRSLAIWQGSSGIYLSDGRSPIPIHNDIKEYFDKNDSRCINLSKIGDSIGFVDPSNQEYHWLFANGSSTTLNKELVYDIKRNKWFEMDRGTGMDLQCGVCVEDTDGNQYTYGFLDTGYMERLEYGNTFDGNAIVSTFQFGDFAPLGLSFETQLDHLKLISVIPATATDDVTCTHYADTATSGTDYTMDVSTTGYRVSKPAFDSKLQGTYHSLKFTKTTDDETSGFKPIAVVTTFHQLGED